MEYPVRIITREDQLSSCERFDINHFQWTCRQRPQAYGFLGYWENRGLLVELTCLEANPKRVRTTHQEAVYRDSAVEAFFAFPGLLEPPSNSGLYFNFEVNANGAMLAAYGHGRNNRTPLTREEIKSTGVSAHVSPTFWMVRFLVPLELLKRVAWVSGLGKGDVFYCNFYKISEDPVIEHYASYCPVASTSPNFHLPRSFAKATVTGYL